MNANDEQKNSKIGNEIRARYKKRSLLEKLKSGMYSRMNQPASRPRRELGRTDTFIQEDWKRGVEEKSEENKNNLNIKTPKKPSNLNNILLFGAGSFAVLSVVIVSVYAFIGLGQPSRSIVDNVKIKAMGPASVKGGSIIKLNLIIKNDSASTLESADLIVNYPQGTRIPTDLASNMTVQRIPLGTIAPNSSRTGTVRAVIFGESGENKTIEIELEYRPKGSSALLVSKVNHNILITSDTLGLTVLADDESIAGQQIDFVVEATSRADIILRDVVLGVEYPFGFIPERMDPAPDSDNNFWEIGDLAPGDIARVYIRGRLKGQKGDERVFRFYSGLRDSVEEESVETRLSSINHLVKLDKPFLNISMLFNNTESGKYVARSGVNIPIEIFWKNDLRDSVSNVVLAASISGDGVNPYTVSANKGFYKSSNSTAIWNKTTTRGELSSVASKDEGSFLLDITPRTKEQMTGIKNPEINIKIHVAGQRLAETGVPEILESTLEETIKIATDAELESEALFYNNPFGSTGPLPPIVHRETTYAVVWEVTNTTNDMRDVVVTAELPPYIRWMETINPVSENVVFKQAEGTLIWYLGDVPAGTGFGSSEPRRLVFNIGLTPSAPQAGISPNLVINQKLKGYDTFAQKDIEAEFEDLTTELKEEDFESGQGTVQRPK